MNPHLSTQILGSDAEIKGAKLRSLNEPTDTVNASGSHRWTDTRHLVFTDRSDILVISRGNKFMHKYREVTFSTRTDRSDIPILGKGNII